MELWHVAVHDMWRSASFILLDPQQVAHLVCQETAKRVLSVSVITPYVSGVQEEDWNSLVQRTGVAFSCGFFLGSRSRLI